MQVPALVFIRNLKALVDPFAFEHDGVAIVSIRVAILPVHGHNHTGKRKDRN